MRVVGAQRHFDYGGAAGSAGCFLARLHHASVAPRAGCKEHLKMAFFFRRRSAVGERRAKRGLARMDRGSENHRTGEEGDPAAAQKPRKV